MIKKFLTRFNLLFFPLAFIYFEIILRIFTKSNPANNAVYLLFSTSLGLFIAFIINYISSPRIRKTVSVILLFLTAFYFILEFYLFRSFGYFYPPETVAHMSSDVLGSFAASVWTTVAEGIYAVPFFLAPPIIMLLQGCTTIIKVVDIDIFIAYCIQHAPKFICPVVTRTVADQQNI